MRPTWFRATRRPALLTVLLLVAIGCGPGTKRPVVPVQGKITFSDGTPLPAGTRVMFEPTEGGLGTASGKTEADGSFTLTHVSGSTGAALGTYSVILYAPEGSDAAAFTRVVPEKYSSPGNLPAEVKEGTPVALKIARAGRR